MKITKEVLQSQLDALKKAFQKTRSDLSAIDGAIQQVEQLIAFEATPEPVPTPPAPAVGNVVPFTTDSTTVPAAPATETVAEAVPAAQ